MKNASTRGALLTLLICLSALTTASAPAAEWLCNGKAIAKAKECLILGVNLEVVLFKDMSAGSEVECPVGSVTGEGFAGPGAAGEVTSVTLLEGGKKCVAPAKAENLKGELVANACIKPVAFALENLPWNTKLETITAKGIEQWITITGSKEKANPGYLFECETIGGLKVADLCEANEAHPLHDAVDNLKADEEAPKLALVDVLGLAETFEENENEWGKCSIGGEHSGLTLGEGLGEAFIGGVAVSLEADK